MLANKDVLEKLAPSANEIDGKSNPRSFDALLKSDLSNFVSLVKAGNIKVE